MKNRLPDLIIVLVLLFSATVGLNAQQVLLPSAVVQGEKMRCPCDKMPVCPCDKMKVCPCQHE